MRVAVLIRLAAATGMRRGEACAVRWNDLDTKAGTVRIDEGIVSTPDGAEARQPKTRSSTRKVALDSVTLSELAELRREQEALARSCGMKLTPLLPPASPPTSVTTSLTDPSLISPPCQVGARGPMPASQGP
jgi:integrase